MTRRGPAGHPLVKRTFDILLAGGLLAVTAPLQAAVAVAVRVSLGRPVLFRQVRPGLHGEPFELAKFRTMRAVEPGRPVAPDAERMTALGRVLRSTSLDELPTLWNVVRGEMSLVGPRPLLMAYLDRYTPEQARRHEVRPGVTGLAQVRGRNALSWPDKFAADVEYVDTRTLWLDLRILAATVRSVLRRQGISADGEVTMPEFLGAESAAS